MDLNRKTMLRKHGSFKTLSKCYHENTRYSRLLVATRKRIIHISLYLQELRLPSFCPRYGIIAFKFLHNAKSRAFEDVEIIDLTILCLPLFSFRSASMIKKGRKKKKVFSRNFSTRLLNRSGLLYRVYSLFRHPNILNVSSLAVKIRNTGSVHIPLFTLPAPFSFP